MIYGAITIGGRNFTIHKIVLSPGTIEFHCGALLPAGTVIPSPSPAVILDPYGARVYRYTYEQEPIGAPPNEDRLAAIVQTITFVPDGPIRAHAWRDRAPIAGLDGPRRPLGNTRREIGQ